MNLIDIMTRVTPPGPWVEGDNITWNDPGFSKRMLKEHLSQDHDAASRRFATIDRQVTWIDRQVLSGRATRILDLGCGPGLYLQRLAKLGHDCVGIDYSPASIAYARVQAVQDALNIDYREEDLRHVHMDEGFGLVMFLFGELNVFPASVARSILKKAYRALRPGGFLLLEVHPLEAIRKRGQKGRSWYTADPGLFRDGPHICLEESFWDPDQCTATVRYFVVDVVSGDVTRHAQSYQAYDDAGYTALLASCGFPTSRRYPSLAGEQADRQADLTVLLSQKP